MVNQKMRLVEQVNFLTAEFIESATEGRMIKNVVLLGPVSKHGYTYKQEAMRKALPMYEGVRCFINHPTKEEERNGSRDVMQLAGAFESVRHEDGKIKGNIRLLDDAYGLKFWNIAHKMPNVASCSHVANGKLVTEGKEQFVEEIESVYSVDLVVKGATTETVFESEFRKENDMDYSKMTIEELRRNRPDIAEALLNEGKTSRDEEVSTVTKENETLKKSVDEFKVKESASIKLGKVEKLLAESKLPKEAKTDLFKEQLMKLDLDKFDESAKSLITDRESLVSGVKNMPAKGNDQAGDGGGSLDESVAKAQAMCGMLD